MRKRRSKEGKELNALIKMGLGHDIASAEFGEQPDSGSRIGGVRGRQEYGIDGALADELSISDEYGVTDRSMLADAAQAASSGFSEFSEEGEGESEEATEEELAYRDKPYGFMSAEDLENLLLFRLRENEWIHARHLKVRVDPSGLVTLFGSVRTDSEKLRAEEVAFALPGVVAVDNKLSLT